MITPQEAAEKLQQHPVETGSAFIAVAILLKIAVLVKVIVYACLSFGLIFLWEAFKTQTKVPAKLVK
jgi:hypothetical protein